MDVPESVDLDLDCSQCEGKYHDIKDNQLLNYKDHQGMCSAPVPVHSLSTNGNFSSQCLLIYFYIGSKNYHSCGVTVLLTQKRAYA